MFTTPTKIFLEIHFKFEKDSFFLSYSLGIETTNTFLLQNHTRFHTETAQTTNHLGRLIYTYETYIAVIPTDTHKL